MRSNFDGDNARISPSQRRHGKTTTVEHQKTTVPGGQIICLKQVWRSVPFFEPLLWEIAAHMTSGPVGRHGPQLGLDRL
jgi:hypothetical protein